MDTNAAPAGEGEAKSILDEYEPDQAREAPEPAAAGEAGELMPAAAEAPSEATAEPAPSAEAGEEGDATAKTRLRDGTEVSLAELKKAFGAQREFEQRKAEFEGALQARAGDLAREREMYAAAISQTIEAAKAFLPRPPDPALRESDFVEYFKQKDEYDQALGELARLEEARAAHLNAAAHAHQAQMLDGIIGARNHFADLIPEFRDESKRNALRADLTQHAADYHYSVEDLGRIMFNDPRAMAVLRDAVAFRKIQAEKARAVEKGRNPPPVQVQEPGRRRAVAERRGQDRQELKNRLRKSGSAKDAEAYLSTFD